MGLHSAIERSRRRQLSYGFENIATAARCASSYRRRHCWHSSFSQDCLARRGSRRFYCQKTHIRRLRAPSCADKIPPLIRTNLRTHESRIFNTDRPSCSTDQKDKTLSIRSCRSCREQSQRADGFRITSRRELHQHGRFSSAFTTIRREAH